ncbi:hypothetical protein BSKO_13373 [Bryopsis sp. KO-2023]|nr:hypothetical protein BSKO_13373 [Bryopsis sp. KO-2023]
MAKKNSRRAPTAQRSLRLAEERGWSSFFDARAFIPVALGEGGPTTQTSSCMLEGGQETSGQERTRGVRLMLDRVSSSNSWLRRMASVPADDPVLIPMCSVGSERMPSAFSSETASSTASIEIPDNLEAVQAIDSKVDVEVRGNTDAEEGGVGSACCVSRRGILLKLLILLVVVGAIVVAFPVLKVYKHFPELLDWIEKNKELGFFTFVAVYAVATVFFVPGAILALGGGFVFGLPVGLLAVWLGGTIGQTLAFLLGRFLLRDWIASKARRFKLWRAIEHVANHQGWKIVVLLRQAPVIPYDALNYAFGLTAIGFWQYFFASTLGIVPGSLLFVYFGSLADCIADIADGSADIDERALIITAVASGLAIIVVVALFTYYAKRALKKMIEEDALTESETPSRAEETPPSSPEAMTDSARNSLSFTGKATEGGGLIDIESGAGRCINGEGKVIIGSARYDRQDTANLDERECLP